MKYEMEQQGVATSPVAPHWGAWIEILILRKSACHLLCRTPLGCVD